MEQRSEDWTFGSPRARDAERSWFAQHEPAVDRWLTELEAACDPWWQSAQHAAYCWVSHLMWEAEMNGKDPSWGEVDIERFLFTDLSEGGTVGLFGSVEIFFDQLVEALLRFTQAGLVEADASRRWTEQMQDARADFLGYYDAATDEDEARAIRTRRHGEISAPAPTPSRAERRASRRKPRRRLRKKRRLGA